MSRAQWWIPVVIGLGIAGVAYLSMPGAPEAPGKGAATASAGAGAKSSSGGRASPGNPGGAGGAGGATAAGQPAQVGGPSVADMTPEQARQMAERLRDGVGNLDPYGNALEQGDAMPAATPGEQVSNRATQMIQRVENSLAQVGKAEGWNDATWSAVNSAVDRYDDQLTAIQAKAASKAMTFPQAIAAMDQATKTVTDEITKAAGTNAATEVAKATGQPVGDEVDLDGWGIPFEEWAAQIEAEQGKK